MESAGGATGEFADACATAAGPARAGAPQPAATGPGAAAAADRLDETAEGSGARPSATVPAPGSPAPPPTGDRARGAAVETIHRELTAFARRARAAAGRMHPQLSLVAYTLLGHLEERGGCRATDLAAHYALDKSTVSRQVAALERAGLVRRRVDPEDHRGQVLDLTAEGTGILAEVTERRRAAFETRLDGWPQDDLARFAAFLQRYNDQQPPPAPPSRHETPPAGN